MATWDPEERNFPHDEDDWKAPRRPREVRMDDRETEREPSRCTRRLLNGASCNGMQYLEVVVEKRFGHLAITVEHRIPTPWPVAVCRRCGAKEEM